MDPGITSQPQAWLHRPPLGRIQGETHSRFRTAIHVEFTGIKPRFNPGAVCSHNHAHSSKVDISHFPYPVDALAKDAAIVRVPLFKVRIQFKSPLEEE